MDLILWRHAEAVDAKPNESDHARRLSKRGERQALHMSKWLERQLPEGTKIWSSPTHRTEQTVLALGRKYKTKAELGPTGRVEDLLKLTQWPHAKFTALVVGHQPLLGQVIAKILGVPEHSYAVRKGAVWWLRYRTPTPEQEAQSNTQILTIQSPEFL